VTSLDAIRGTAGGSLNIRSTAIARQSDFSSLLEGAEDTAASSGAAVPAPSNGPSDDSGSLPIADATSTSASAAAKLRDALAAFEKEAHKTPAERAHDQILAKHQLTEDGYKALPPDQKKEIDQEIVERTRLLMKNGQTAGDAASVSAGAAVALALT